VTRPNSLDLDGAHNESNKVYETTETEEGKTINQKEVKCQDVKPREKSKSENVSKGKEKNEKDCNLHTLPKIKNVRKRGILKKMSTIYTDHPAISELSEKESPKRKRSHSNPPPNSEDKEQNIGSGEKNAGKKKIIPIRSFSDSSPESPYSPALDPPVYRKQRERKSKSTINLTMQEDKEMERKKKSLGTKLNSSYSSILDQMKHGRIQGLRERYSGNVSMSMASSLDGNSFLSLNPYPDTYTGPPSGMRIVLGREKSPTPDIPHQVLEQYNGKTREDLIEMILNHQSIVDVQGCKIIDLEDYIDNLIIKVLDTAPVLLEREVTRL